MNSSGSSSGRRLALVERTMSKKVMGHTDVGGK